MSRLRLQVGKGCHTVKSTLVWVWVDPGVHWRNYEGTTLDDNDDIEEEESTDDDWLISNIIF